MESCHKSNCLLLQITLGLLPFPYYKQARMLVSNPTFSNAATSELLRVFEMLSPLAFRFLLSPSCSAYHYATVKEGTSLTKGGV